MVGGRFGARLVFLGRSAPASGPPYGYPTTKVKHLDSDSKEKDQQVNIERGEMWWSGGGGKNPLGN